MPIAGVNDWRGWTPEASDLSFGTSLRKSWRDFLYLGKLSDEFQQGGCTAYGKSGIPEACEESRCSVLQDTFGFGMNFWWVN